MKQLAVHPNLMGVAVFGYSDGSIKRNDSYTGEPYRVKEPDGVAIESVRWEPLPRPWWAIWRKRRYRVRAKRVDGGSHLSYDDGKTWV